MAILLCLCDIVQGMLFTPLKRGLFPRHLRAEKARFFVHARILDGSSRHAGRKGKKSFKKIVQTCALSCKQKKRLIGASKVSIVAVY
ncbi:hypothetical protein CV530_002119 [Escherichia coli]|uniref:hypothetical protein n=1 Tax=Escherichia coli TaxID=562 RepID=UPI0012FF89E7|nr:hypothetical protein [Escherichia coli]EFB9874354.1 hypothetical protein [Escherichia coli]EFF5408313.1 hypothetical protein [Escherichia coli]EFL6602740.1 hypothetical protein [Escherichia coli]EHC4989864.1 hypothetical protein [Escherichia coli]EHP3267392.1 hypothetical protein [Escherichia coli]